MTNKERLISLLGFSPDENTVIGTLMDMGISSSDTYEVSNSIALKKAAIQCMEVLLTTADTTNENSYQITYDRAAVEARIKQLKGELGIKDGSMPTIKAIKAW